jgi:hypothetical protein
VYRRSAVAPRCGLLELAGHPHQQILLAVACDELDANRQAGETWSDEGGTTLGRAGLTKTFQGDIEGGSIAHLVTAQTDAPVAYCGLERLAVTVHGRTGAFVLQHHAGTGVDGTPLYTLVVVPETGAGELAGLAGSGTITRHEDGSHTFTLDYRFGGAG